MLNLFYYLNSEQRVYLLIICFIIMVYEVRREWKKNFEKTYQRKWIQKENDGYMMFPSARDVDAIKQKYPVGTRIKLIFMHDGRAIKPGSEGTVHIVDDAGTIHVDWDNGRRLGIIANIDQFEVIEKEKDSN